MKLTSIQFLCYSILVQLVAAVPTFPGGLWAVRRRMSHRAVSSEYQYDKRTKLTSRVQGPFKFLQTLDHSDTTRSPLFHQRYWVKDKHYVHRGPIFLLVSGENNGKNILNMLESDTMFNRMAKENKGMLVVLEHRYFGESFPYIADLSEENLKYLTIEQVLKDLRRFASKGMNNMALRAGGRASESAVPWVLVGGGYSGGLVHWALNEYPETFWAGYSSSGMVQAKQDFWKYWDDVAKKMPKACANDVAVVVKYFDDVVASRNETRINQVIKQLQLSQFEHLDDIAEILSIDIATWLNVDYLSPLLDQKYRFQEFCDALELDEKGQDGRRGGRGLSWALEAWGNWNMKAYGNLTDAEWSSYDRNRLEYTDLELYSNRGVRASKWIRCNELGWFKAHQPKAVGNIVSTQLTLGREWRICTNYFPSLVGKAGPDVRMTNDHFGGWSKIPTRVVYMIGGNDPYIGASVRDKTDDVVDSGSVVMFVDDAHHLSDFVSKVPSGLMNTYQKKCEEYIRYWVNV